MKAALVAFLLLATIAHRCEARSRNRLPPSASQALSAPNTVILYSLEPEEEADASDPRLQYVKILGQTELDRKRTATAINAFKTAISDWDGIIASCFNPRHAIRVAARGHTYDFLLCYECHQLYVYEDDKLLRGLGVMGSPEILNTLLTTAAIPLARTESEEEIAARRKKDREVDARWLAGMPKSLRRFWTDEMRQGLPPADLKPLRAPLAREFPDATRRILALFNWYGSGAGPWNGFPSYEDFPARLLLDFPTAELIAAIEGAELTDFELKGASRFFAASDFSRECPGDLELLPPGLKKRLLEHSLQSSDSDNLAWAKDAFGEP